MLVFGSRTSFQALKQQSICTSRRSLLPVAANSFAKKPYDDGLYVKDDPNREKFIKEQQQLLESMKSEKEINYLRAERYSDAYASQMSQKDEKAWWNKLNAMDQAELELLPYGFLKKYGSYLNTLKLIQEDQKLYENRSIDDNFKQIKHLNELMTNEEKQDLQDFKDHKERTPYLHNQYDKDGYFYRQPRVDMNKENYNFEQYNRYTKMYEEAKEKDDKVSMQLYKLIKYVKQNKDKQGSDTIVTQFMSKYDPDLIEIPEEFANVVTDDVEENYVSTSRRNRRKFIRTKSDKNLAGYDAWRCTDRSIKKGSGRQHAVAKLMIAPALLVRTFGTPGMTETGFHGTGEYHFEDNNLDVFNLYDYKKTDFFHGFNREDDYYTTKENMAKKPHARKRKWPSIDEFWASEEPVEFKLGATDQSQWRKFKKWLKRTLKQSDARTDSYKFDEDVQERFGKEFDICFGGYNEKGVVNTNMAVFNWDYTYHMSPEEIKALKDKKPEKLIPPKYFDLAKAERVYITKEELKQMELEREQALQAASVE